MRHLVDRAGIVRTVRSWASAEAKSTSFICVCGHHSRCHLTGGGRCEHRTCACLIFEPDANAETIALATEPVAITRSASAKHVTSGPDEPPHPGELDDDPRGERDRWERRQDLE